MARAPRKAQRRGNGDGTVRQLPSMRWQARYFDDAGTRHTAPKTFDTKAAAQQWLANDVASGIEESKEEPLLRTYAAGWMKMRQLSPRTYDEYETHLERRILPELGDIKIKNLKAVMVRSWYSKLNADTPTLRARTYGLLKAILNTALEDDLIEVNPCRIRNAGSSPTKHQTKVATQAQLATMVELMPENLRLMLLLGFWCGLRFGEVTELRRKDIEGGVIHISRGVVRVKRRAAAGEDSDDGPKWEFHVGPPKTRAGIRSNALPPHLVPALEEHMQRFVGADPESLLFEPATSSHLAPSTFYRHYYRARDAAGRPDLHFHDLRHTSATATAGTGASLADNMKRHGHATASAAMRYQHAAEDSDLAIANALSELVGGGTVTSIRDRRSAG